MPEQKGRLGHLLQGFLLLLVVSILGIAIAILVTTVNVQKQQKVPIVVYNNTVVQVTVPTLQDQLNVPKQSQVAPGSPQYSSYASVVTLLQKGLNQSINPCDDFYRYTCGNYKGSNPFSLSNTDNYNKMAAQMQNQTYVDSAPLPVQQTVWLFNQCKTARANWNNLFSDGVQVTNAINAVKAGDPFGQSNTKNFPFPMLDQTSNVTEFPDRVGMGYLLAQPLGMWGVTTMVSAFVDTNWADPQGSKGYAMFIDQPTTFLPYTYYVKSWTSSRQNLINEIVETMNAYVATQNKTLDQTKLLADATDLVNFDYLLAMNLSTDDTTRRQYGRSFNPMTIKQLGARYPAISWHEYIPMAMVQTEDAMQIVGDPSYTYIVMEPEKLQIFHDALVPGNNLGITPNLILNYVYYSVVRSQSDYLPSSSSTTAETIAELRSVSPQVRPKRRRGAIVPHKNDFKRKQMNDPNEYTLSCTGETMGLLQYANARIFIDNIYPTQDSRDSIRNSVAKVASSILIGFRSMIDQLDWMTSQTKKGAYNKIDNLVRNIAYPDWIANDTQLSQYYASINISSTDDYVTIVTKANNFNLNSMWNLLVQSGSANRIDFNGPPGTTNAWYQPEMNSITFPAGILHQPFYDPNWPAAINFGAMGMIAGHELTHGFDDQGVQWDGVGNLNSWMDNSSLVSFNQMAGCVINEYSSFCPLNSSTYGAGACVDGAQTQGENIADNGGIHAAFRAYKNYINLNGPDPLLPDAILQGFSADQLFFLAFAQVWCQVPPTDGAMNRQILVDVHSPAMYRVWGTLQNFPAFKDAFSCPNSAYAPDKHCNVWVSDISSSYGAPQPDPNSLNIRQAKAAVVGQPQYSNYQSVIQLFKQGLNTTADPCNDFYSYTCGAWKSPDMSFDVSDDSNFALMVDQMSNTPYVNGAPNPVKQVVKYYNECINFNVNYTTMVADGAQATKAIQSLMNGDTTEDGSRQNSTKTFWPMWEQNATKTYTSLPDNVTMGFLLGYPGGTYGISTLISAYVDTNWVDPQGSQGYAYYIDQPTTMVPNTYYRKVWGTYQGYLQKMVIATLNDYAATQNRKLDQTQLQQDAIDIVNFDYALAMNFSTDDTTRRNFLRSYNPMTIGELQAKYGFLFWHEFIPLTMLPAVDSQHATLHNSTYKFIVMEPDMLQKLNDAIMMASDPNNPYKFTPNTIINYIYYIQLNSQGSFIPSTLKIHDRKAYDALKEAKNEDRRRGRRRGVVPRRKRRNEVTDNLDSVKLNCAAETMYMLQYANARVFVDKIYPTQNDRDAVRNNVAKLASSIVIGFRSMIDQLNWMTTSTKKGAYAKIENLVKNIAFPDWITDDNLLTAYHATLGINDSDTYFDVYNKAIVFSIYQQFELLSKNGSANRIDFNGPPGTTNAWYQPELNSITFPAAILHQPFYDPNWPASVNFGAMGVIAGHELTHGFDDEGVQWDGVGNLNGWMDASSQANFTNMANCVVNEYSNFCPLDKDYYGSSACVDGAQTQGENIADNGGIHAAFRAYKNYINLYGPDPQLPDGLMGGFTADQLFFLAFAQVWCQLPPSDGAMNRQILVDVHSPSIYRVWGTIQNFPAFKDAFSCPNSAYAPDKHCNVWVSDISSSYGAPQPDPNSLNIRQAKAAVVGQPQYSNYQSVIQLFKQGLNTTADPCNDFYSYTCGAWNASDMMSFYASDDSNLALMVDQMSNKPYVDGAPNPVKQVVKYYNECINFNVNYDTMVADGAQATKAIQSLMNGDTTEDGSRQNSTKSFWPMWEQNSLKSYTSLPDNVTMGFLLGYPGGTYGISTLISAYVDTNWVDPQGSQGYAYYIDQPTTMLPNTYYRKAWGTYQGYLQRSVIGTMNDYAATQNRKLDQTQLQQDAIDIVNFDYALAMNFSTDDTTRRNYLRSYNPMTIGELQAKYGFLFWHEFIPLTMLPAVDSQHTTLHNSTYKFIVMEPDMLQKLNDAIMMASDPNNPYKFTPNTIINYIYYNQLSSQGSFIPSTLKLHDRKAYDALKEAKNEDRRRGRRRGVVPRRKRWGEVTDDLDAIKLNCAAETMYMLQYANARVFIDKIYPTQNDRDTVRNNVAKLASSILIGFRSMIDQLNWMTTFTKKGAYGKIENLVKNIAFPDWITDDNLLTAYHATLGINDSDTYFDVYNKAIVFGIYQQFELLSKNGSANRIDFNGPPGTTNAWYQPELNSITFPAAILHQPFYDPNWPASVNFGAMGVIAGHELTHGFDDEGVQWDGVGNLNGWMDASSQANFTNMANCVVNEYSNFCPLDKNVYGSSACVDGAQTQGENIADNGGIHAAFRAYKNYINLNGPDPQLPDGLMGGFTADQLFFLAFAQVWCQLPPSDGAMNRQILVDVHSPSIYRVWGTIQNFPAFKDAFSCPNSAYAPDKHCNVWVSDISSSYGLPDVKQSDINIPAPPQAKQSDQDTYNSYQQSVAYFQASVNLSADPCNDFYSYSCGKYDKLVSFHLADAANLVLMAQQLTDPNYSSTIAANSALTKEKQFFDACVNVTQDASVNNQTLVSQNYMLTKVQDLQNLLGGATFTAVQGGTITKLPDANAMASALGWLSFTQQIDTYISPMVDTYWLDNTRGYQFFVDQNTAEMSKTYYQPQAWNKTTRPGYLTSTVAVFQTYCKEQNLPCNPNDLNNIVGQLIDFEQKIAYIYSTDDTTRRQYKRSWNEMTLSDMNTKYTFVNWTAYVNQMIPEAQNIVGVSGYKVIVMEPNMTLALSTDLQNSALFDPNLVVNYLYMRLLLDNAQYLPTYRSALADFPQTKYDDLILGKKRRRVFRKSLPDVTDTQTSCISLANDLMQFANGRVFIDYLYPTDNDRAFIRQKAGGVITNIISSFQGMLLELDWMTSEDKASALNKTLGIQQNIAYPDWIMDDRLNQYYNQLNFTATDNYYTMWDKLIKFNLYLQYHQLSATTTDRSDFLGQPGTVNAWYQPELNSITFPAGILRPPYYSAGWPASVNYGGLGVVAGHELTHGFDDEGVQWDKTGNLNSWMVNQTSKDGFQNMADCVIQEYSNFCPLNATDYTPNCVNGYQTQGENIADNGGIHSAFRAYRTHIQLNGPDPMLPDQLIGQFTHDQLFFLSFGQVWCERYRGDAGEYKQLMVDPHSPSKYRVWGTIQNYPAFQAAFNCPANSAYAPTKHCNVWVPNVEQ